MIKINSSYLSIRNIGLILIVAIAYFISAKTGLLLHSNVTPVWPPAGIALGAILLLGCRVWPGIALGAFVVNFAIFYSNKACDTYTAIWVSLLISVGNTLETLIGFYLLNKSEKGVSNLGKVQHVFRYLSIVLIICFISSTIGCSAICIAKIVSWDQYLNIWLIWSLGDIAATLIIAPLLLTWANYYRTQWKWNQTTVKTILLYVFIFLIAGVVFLNWIPTNSLFVRAYFILPLLLWAAFGFELRVVVTALALASTIAIIGTANGNGPFVTNSITESILSLQVYISIISISILILRAAINESQESEIALKNVNTELLIIIKQRNDELKDNQNRINAIFKTLINYTVMDFSLKIPISEKRDEIDAIATGLNSLGEELEFAMGNQVKNTEELKQINEFLNTILENIPNMVFVKDAKELRFVRFNKAGEELLGFKREELMGKNDYDFFSKEQADFFTEKDAEVLKNGKLHDIPEEPINTKYKGTRILETKKIPILDEKGNPLYLLGISNDITERKKVDDELKHKSEELARSNTELEQFAYVASHDLQEPLRMVTSYLQLIEKRYKDKLDQDANEFIQYAVDGSYRMRTLIQSLLEYSRINRAKPFEWIDLSVLLNDVLGNISELVKENNAIIKVPKLPKIFGDYVLIDQLFQNLIANAIKFRSSENPEITISVTSRNNEYLFSVKDNGIGIQEEYSDKIFVIFQRLHSKEKYAGTGIGLAICKKIVERHGGKIWVESEIGKGSTFYFTIKQSVD
jgi:PAS domain S-box-containing protein